MKKKRQKMQENQLLNCRKVKFKKKKFQTFANSRSTTPILFSFDKVVPIFFLIFTAIVVVYCYKVCLQDFHSFDANKIIQFC